MRHDFTLPKRFLQSTPSTKLDLFIGEYLSLFRSKLGGIVSKKKLCAASVGK